MKKRPRTRGDCLNSPRPCPHFECRYHLDSFSGFPSRKAWESAYVRRLLQGDMGETCCLDVADRGRHTLEEVGDIIGTTRERVRQIQDKALIKLKYTAKRRRFLKEGDINPESFYSPEGFWDL